MSLKLIQYFIHTLKINSQRVGGVQSVTVGKSFNTTNITGKGLPTNVKNFYQKPELSISFTKFMSDDYSSFLSGFDIRNEIYKTPPEKYDIEIGIVGGGGLKFVNTVLGGVTYNFTNQGDFTEELSFIGHVSEAISSIAAPAVEYGQTKRRQHFIKANIPSEIPSSTLLSVTASMNINYGTIPTFGKFYTHKNKYITYPVDISCTYEVLDKGYSQARSDYTGSNEETIINDEVSYRSIVISGVPSVNLGDKNILTNVDRNGGDAGNNDYSIYRYTYKNNDNSFSVS